MKTRTIEIFQFDELSETAKEKAREWFGRASDGDNFFAECPTEEFEDALKIFGFVPSRRSIPLHSGKTRAKPEIYWSGFSSQGDGAYFLASWYASHVDSKQIAAFIADRPETYTNEKGKQCESKSNKEGNRLAREFLALATKYPESSGSATNQHRGNNQSADFDIGIDRSDEEHTIAEWKELETTDELAADEFKELVRDCAEWFYRILETEYEYQNSDEQIDESIRANEAEFNRDGTRA